MAKTASLNIRTDPETKSRSEQLFGMFGITVTDAVNMFLRQSIMVGGLPFELKQPRYNTDTEAAIQEARDMMSGKTSSKSYSSLQEMIDELENEPDEEG